MRTTSALLAVLFFLAPPAQAQNLASPEKSAANPSPPASPDINLPAPKADPFATVTQALNDEWAEIFYRQPAASQAEKFKALLPRLAVFKAQYPNRAEPLILEAITLCTLVASEWSFSALSRINTARELLEKAIDINPKAMEGAAYITLGNLYYRLPGWPISFGDDDVARQYLEAAVRLYPDALDSNYFLGDYWLNEDEYDKALPYLEKAKLAPARASQRLSDARIQKELEKALRVARGQESGRDDFFSEIVPNFAQ